MRTPTSHFVIGSTYAFTAVLWLAVAGDLSPSVPLAIGPAAGLFLGAVLELLQMRRRRGAVVLSRAELIHLGRLLDRDVDERDCSGTVGEIDFSRRLRRRVQDALDDRTPGEVDADALRGRRMKPT